MGQIIHQCLHCKTEKMAMKIFGGASYEGRHTHQTWFGAIAAYCVHCSSPHSFLVECDLTPEDEGSDFQYTLDELLDEDHKTPTDYGLRVKVVETPNPDIKTPTFLPDKVESAFLSAIENMKSPHGNDAAAIMFRRSIENAIKIKYPDLKGDLMRKIAALEEQSILPCIMKDWAHQIRIIGNNGAHELEGIETTDVQAAYNFTDAFLRYLVSLPEEVKKRRDANE